MKKLYSLFIIISAMLVYSCKKAEGPDPKRYLNAPLNLDLDLHKTILTANWEYPDDGRVSGFRTEVASDPDFKNILETDTVGADIRTFTFKDLGYFSSAYVRVRTLARDIVLHSAYATSEIVPESVFIAPDKADIAVSNAVLRWTKPATGTVTDLLIIKAADNSERSIKLSADNVSAGSIDVSGLESAQTYTAVLFDGEDRKGVLSFTMKDINASISIEGGSAIFESLQDAIDAAKSGDIINVGAAKYDFIAGGAINISDKSLTIRSKNVASVPEISAGPLNLKGNVASLTLSGIKWITTGSQTIVISELTSKTSISIDKADFSGASSGFIYSATSTPATAALSLKVTKTLFHDFGNTGGDFIDFRGANISDISFSNCSFWNLARAFLRIDASASCASATPFLFENCTFNNICSGSSSRFIYVRSAGAKTTFNKCIITNLATSTGNGVSGTGTSLSFTNTNTFGSNQNVITGVSTGNSGNTNLDPQYAAAASGDFTIGNATIIAAGLGDGRWIK